MELKRFFVIFLNFTEEKNVERQKKAGDGGSSKFLMGFVGAGRLPGHKAEHHQKSATAAASLLPPSPAFFCVPTCFFLDAVKKTYNSQLYSLHLSKNNFLTPCVAYNIVKNPNSNPGGSGTKVSDNLKNRTT